MSTTTVRLDEKLKARVASVARKAGVRTHSFILQAIAEKAEQCELQSAFHDEATARFEKFIASGKSVPWIEMRTYLERRVDGHKVAKPRAKNIVR